MTNPPTSQPDPGVPPVSAFAGDTRLFQQHPAIKPPRCPGGAGALDNYDLLSLIGQGGMGLVFRARDTTNDKIVAVKLLRTELAGHAQAQHRFAREVDHMSKLRHPNILEVLAVGTRQDIPYFAMPFVERGSLAGILRPDALLDRATCLRIALGIAQALQYAHTKGITHRDLKPGNVLLGPGDTPLLTDFGLARTLFNDSLINVDQPQAEGTAAYMSPQMARLEAEDTRCDIYAFGALLYEMLTGRVPYEGESNAIILEKIKRGPPVPIAQLRPDAPADLAHIAETAMAREQRDRYASMDDVVADLERIEKGGKPHAKARMGLGRRRVLALATCVLLVALLAVLMLLPRRVELRQRWSFSRPEVVQWANAPAGEWDGDGAVDFMVVSGTTLFGVSSQGRQYPPLKLELPPGSSAHLGLLHDINGDRRDEAFVVCTQGTNAQVIVFNQHGWPLKRFHFQGRVHVHPEWRTNCTRLMPLCVADLDRDGIPELLAAVNSNWEAPPRGLACFNIETSALKWFFPTAPFLPEIDLLDVNTDGRLEILVGSSAPNNGQRLPDGTDDSHAYAYLLDAQGNQLWRQTLGGIHVKALPVIGRKQAVTPLVWVASLGVFDRKTGIESISSLVEFNAAGRTVQQANLDEPMTSAIALDLDNDGRDEILAADWRGNLHLFNHQLRKLRSMVAVTNGFSEVQVDLEAGAAGGKTACFLVASKQVERLNEIDPGNKRSEFHNHRYQDPQVTIFDSRLRPIASHHLGKTFGDSFGFSARLISSPNQDATELVVLSDKVEIYTLIQRSWWGEKPLRPGRSK